MTKQTKQTPTHNQIKDEFEAYQAQKYRKWKELINQPFLTIENGEVKIKTDEQNAFDSYVQDFVSTVQDGRIPIVDTRNENRMPEWYTTNKSKSVIYEFKDTGVISIPGGKSENGNWVTVNTLIPWVDTGLPPVQLAYSSKNSHIYYRSGVVSGNSWEKWNEIGQGGQIDPRSIIDDHVEVGNKTWSSSKIRVEIDRSAGGGGGTVSSIRLPTTNNPIETIYGKFGVNLFDYRWLANNWNNPYLFVNGKVFSNKGKQAKPDNSKYYVGGSEGIAGVKEGRQITINSIWKTPINDDNLTKFHIQYNDTKNATSETSTISAGATGDTTHNSNFYGTYSFTLGSDNKQKPTHGEVSIQPYYGEIKPKGLSRKFEFYEYNGVELKSNYHDGVDTPSSWGLRDEYKKTTMFDEVTYKLGKVRLKDCNVYRPFEQHTGGVDDPSLFLCVELPPDASRGSLSAEHSNDQLIGSQALTSNLPESSNLLDEQILAGKDTVPHFMKDIVRIPVIEKQKDGTEKRVLKDCWIIISSVPNAYRHQDLLSKTEIIYPLASPKKVKIPNSGFIVTLSDGSYIESWKYTQISDVGDGCYEFKASTLGYQPIKIQKSQIVAVSPKV